jgi:molecular chaperone DnaK
VTVHVLQGERGISVENRSLGRFDLVGIPPSPRGVPQIEVTFSIDSNGIVNVGARDMATGKEQSIDVSPAGGLSKAEIDALIAEADMHRVEDQDRREIRLLQNRLEGLIHNNDRVFKEFGAALAQVERDEVRGTLDRARKALANEERSVLEEAILAVQTAGQILTQVIMVDPMAALGIDMKGAREPQPEEES